MSKDNKQRLIGILVLSLCIALIFILDSHRVNSFVSLENVTEGRTGNVVSIYEALITPKQKMWVTHYCSCEECTGQLHGDKVIGAEGTELIPYVSVASNLPFGTRLLITHSDGSQEEWIVQDRGNLGKNHLDLYVPSHEEALSIPNEWVEVQIVG